MQTIALTHTRKHAHKHECTHPYTHTHTHADISSMNTHTHTRMHTHTLTFQAWTHTPIHVCTHTRWHFKHERTHPYTHAHTRWHFKHERTHPYTHALTFQAWTHTPIHARWHFKKDPPLFFRQNKQKGQIGFTQHSLCQAVLNVTRQGQSLSQCSQLEWNISIRKFPDLRQLSLFLIFALVWTKAAANIRLRINTPSNLIKHSEKKVVCVSTCIHNYVCMKCGSALSFCSAQRFEL